ncbi:MAG: hypothetical protein KAW17_00495 [Candidatus Eisenbacteria sp.]|nr:hypothetical protein [Candidatus Eisenbacteria bacterium]
MFSAQSIAEKLAALDRRIIFLLVGIVVLIPLLVPLDLPVVVSRETRDFHDEIEALSDSAVLMLAIDYEPDTMAELDPMTLGVLRHCFRKGVRVVALSLYAGAPGIAQRLLEKAAGEYGRAYGEDYIYLGYNPDWSGTMLRLGESIKATYPKDQWGTPSVDLPLLKNVDSYDDVDLLVCINGSKYAEFWAAYAQARYGQRMVSGNTAVMSVFIYQYYNTGQISGFLGGIRGAAEYEKMLGLPADGTIAMGSQSCAHVLIVLLIIAGNVGYLLARRAKRKGSI